jgi:hypothetical protein
VNTFHALKIEILVSRPEQIWQMFKKKLPQWSMLPAEVEVTHFYGTGTVASLFTGSRSRTTAFFSDVFDLILKFPPEQV